MLLKKKTWSFPFNRSHFRYPIFIWEIVLPICFEYLKIIDSNFIFTLRKTYVNIFLGRQCVILDCERPNSTDNGVLALTSTTEGSIALYVCKSGYGVSSGHVLRTCGSDGRWTGEAPVCEIGKKIKKKTT